MKAWVGGLVLPLFALLFMATIFGRGTMDRLPVGVVDHDATASSRQLVRQADASPSLHVVRRFTDEAEARQAMQRGEVYGYLRIPYGYESDLFGGRRPALVVVYHYALLSVGSRVVSAFRTAIAGDRTPFLGLSFPLYNPALNYAVYLVYPFFFILLQALCLVVTIYTWQGREGRGKRLAFCFVSMSGVSLLAHLVFLWMGIPMEGAAGRLWVASVGLIGVTQGVGAAMARFSPDRSTAMSAGSMFGSLGATLSGVTFPLSALPEPVQLLSAIFPIRWFVEYMQLVLYQ